MTDQPDSPPPPASDGTGAPRESPSGSSPISAQPWSTPSGDPLSAQPYQPPSYSPGQAPIPPPPDYPPTSQFPAVNYAPPGQAPDYGAPAAGYSYPPPPAGYGYPPQQPPPPRRSNAPIIAVILAVTLLLCGGIATAGVLIARSVKDKADETVNSLPTSLPEVPALPTDVPTDGAGSGREITVTYEVTGDGPVSIVYIEKIGASPTRLEDVQLPWKFTAKAKIPALLSVVAVRIATSEGTVSCRALVDGKEVKQNESASSNFATTSCVQLVLE
ncbi:MmpS family transport accessory protein [Actinoplanes sp. NPDC026619]|uniref:MmpS family transport accessory protein n=1 Tax=Actinoplanes sp. NPDC026619 TaxID=3155798 RepID=UPI0033E35809